MDNYLVTGRWANELMALPCTSAWGDDGVLGWVEQVDARVIVLGMPWEYCGLYHRAEQVARVPYRYFKRFTGVRTIDGKDAHECSEVQYVRSLNVPILTDHLAVRQLLESVPGVRSAEDKGIKAVSNSARRIIEQCVNALRRDPYAFVSNKKAVQAWVDCGKFAERAALSPEERVEVEP
jgi:aminoglycoside N3'-acetyltransferase